jgi:hypothetical protein
MYSFMARLRDLQKKVNVDAKIKYFAASTSLLETLDSFALTKTDKGVKLIACLGMFKQEFNLNSVFDIAQPLGDWLCSLPKGVWNDKKM